MENKKMTKKDYFTILKTVVAGMETVGEVAAEDVIAFLDKQIEQIDNKAAKAKAKAADKKAGGDALRDAVEATLTEEYQTIDAISAQVDMEDITKAKVTSRLTQLVNAEIAEKEQIKEEGSNRKVMAYRLKQA